MVRSVTNFLTLTYTGFLTLTLTMCNYAHAEELHVAAGRTVKIHYSLSIADEIVETTQGQEPIEFVQGSHELLPKLEQALEGMVKGEKKIVILSALDGYGEADPQAFRELPISILPENVEPEPGLVLELESSDGDKIPAVIMEIQEESIIVDLNHPLAGEELKFDVEIMDVR